MVQTNVKTQYKHVQSGENVQHHYPSNLRGSQHPKSWCILPDNSIRLCHKVSHPLIIFAASFLNPTIMTKELIRKYIWLTDTVNQADSTGITFKEIQRKWERNDLLSGGNVAVGAILLILPLD